ncbi:MAG: NAD(P)H-dependent oxidoreductase [Myxococcota bacterium]|nr:NAD(P)H-dependent oxidoreductase [Myxococcota bacterium]
MFLKNLNWRYATKKMDPSKAVPADKVEQIVEAVRLAPTSSGLQPFELFVITNDAVREQIRPVAWNQSVITEGSHLLVFAAWDNYTAERIDEVVDLMVEKRGHTPMLEAYYTKLKAAYVERDPELNYAHAARQAYIALGFAMAAAAELQVDCTPIEGFSPEKVDEILGLREKGLRSVVLLPLGYRAEEGDWLLPMAKVRKPVEKMVSVID